MKDSNTIKARHFNVVDGNFKFKSKEYYWHIPKALRSENIQEGDVVTVQHTGKYNKKVVVTAVFREDIEDTSKKYKAVLSKLDRAAYLNKIMQKKQKAQSEQS